MAKSGNLPPSGPAPDADDPVTPPPDVTLEPVTPTPEIIPLDNSRMPPGVPRAAALVVDATRELGVEGARSLRSSQPVQSMHDEATVPLPVEEVEFAEADGEILDEDIAPVPVASAAAEAGRPAPPPRGRHPGTPPVRLDGRPRPRASADGGEPAAPAARPAVPPMPPRRPARPRPPTPIAGTPLTAPPSASVAPPPGPAGSVHPFLQPGATWAEALSQRPRRKRLKPWFEEAFDEDYLRTLPFMTPDQTLREVAFIKSSLKPPPEGELLDVACGYGRHAIELGQGGYRVTGIDLSLPLLIRAADESQRRSLSVNFIHADMREMAFENQFDGAYNFLTSFGYFDEEANLKVAASIFRALRPGGRFLIDAVNRDYIVSGLPTRVWWEGDGCVVLEEVDFNFQTSRLTVRRSVVFQDGRQVEHDMSIRAYSLHELGKLLRQAGFRVLEVSGGVATQGYFFGATSRSVIMLCEKPAD
jgi:SAM-dependent methyltransferase